MIYFIMQQIHRARLRKTIVFKAYKLTVILEHKKKFFIGVPKRIQYKQQTKSHSPNPPHPQKRKKRCQGGRGGLLWLQGKGLQTPKINYETP